MCMEAAINIVQLIGASVPVNWRFSMINMALDQVVSIYHYEHDAFLNTDRKTQWIHG